MRDAKDDRTKIVMLKSGMIADKVIVLLLLLIMCALIIYVFTKQYTLVCERCDAITTTIIKTVPTKKINTLY